ncbi:hypothetical protein IE077_001647 [Cardiosporidium cionae]|uniref:Uncharacterized protein n=1 Tax=Cardiosporidium cionae TaxID=476202 RepID=A0ABQ7J519_9APIC|nr:hypothetical protein IE077_001647 [Cardiosporidium cionae]|eukprot:KAF8819110.1 hypothetical protein IE077_001647 [Cardiosporidium cionae]
MTNLSSPNVGIKTECIPCMKEELISRVDEDRTRASSEGDSSNNEATLGSTDYEEEHDEATIWARFFPQMCGTQPKGFFKSHMTDALAIMQSHAHTLSYGVRFQEIRGIALRLLKYLPFAMACIPCIGLLTLPFLGCALLFLVAALPAISMLPAVFFAILPLLWPYLEFDKKKLPLSKGVILSIAVLMVPICSAACLPIFIGVPFVLLFLLPVVVVFLPALLIVFLPVLIPSIIKTQVQWLLNCLYQQKRVDLKKLWFRPVLSSLKSAYAESG